MLAVVLVSCLSGEEAALWLLSRLRKGSVQLLPVSMAQYGTLLHGVRGDALD